MPRKNEAVPDKGGIPAALRQKRRRWSWFAFLSLRFTTVKPGGQRRVTAGSGEQALQQTGSEQSKGSYKDIATVERKREWKSPQQTKEGRQQSSDVARETKLNWHWCALTHGSKTFRLQRRLALGCGTSN